MTNIIQEFCWEPKEKEEEFEKLYKIYLATKTKREKEELEKQIDELLKKHCKVKLNVMSKIK